MIEQFTGKTIKAIEEKQTWDKNHIESIVLRFTDGTSLEITAMTTKGCGECDDDGSNPDYLSFWGSV